MVMVMVTVMVMGVLNNVMSMTVCHSQYYYHSTETHNDMLLAADSSQLTARCLHDLTAACDTVDHDLLLLHLERQFGLQGVALEWFRSYLSSSLQVFLSATLEPVIHRCLHCVHCSSVRIFIFSARRTLPAKSSSTK